MKDHVHSPIDPTKLDALVDRAVTALSAGHFGVMISLGDCLGPNVPWPAPDS